MSFSKKYLLTYSFFKESSEENSTESPEEETLTDDEDNLLIEENSKPIISVGQALLILIDHYNNDHDIVNKLKKLYLSGSCDMSSKTQINIWMTNELLKNYTVSTEMWVINEDAIRRYFETHLAFHTLYDTLNKIKHSVFEQHFNILHQLDCSIYDRVLNLNLELSDDLYWLAETKKIRTQLYAIFDNKEVDTDDLMLLECIDILKQLNSMNYKHFSQDQKDKILLLVKSSFLSWFIVGYYGYCVTFPLDIYEKDFFSDEQRGRLSKENNDVKSSCLGLMKSYMPLPFFKDIAYGTTLFPYVRGPDRYNFDPESRWPKHNFDKLVHPYSCSISGTMLINLRLFCYLNSQNMLIINDNAKFTNYIKCFSSLMLFHVGGHSFHEFLAPLSLPKVQAGFVFIPGFEKINMVRLLLINNENAFDTAINKAIYYNNIIINKKIIHHFIEHNTPELNKK